MPFSIKPSCVICAWRTGCNKQFSIANPSHCPDFSLDVSVKRYPGKKGVKVLVEGRPGSGKTTLVERLIMKLGKDKRVGGFFTREIREMGERKGFSIISVDKQEGVLAHVNFTGSFKVGKYAVDLEPLEKIGVASIERALRDDELIVIDEIGKMALFSGHFAQVVDIAFESEKPLVATIPDDLLPFVEGLKAKDGVKVLTLTPDNREEILDEALKLVLEG